MLDEDDPKYFKEKEPIPVIEEQSAEKRRSSSYFANN